MTNNKQDIIDRFTSKGVFPHQMAFTLLIPLRNIFLSPKKLIKRMNLAPSHQVLEIGPGPGYFSLQVAKFLTQGKIVLADIQQEMLDYAKKRLGKSNISNTEYYLCNGEKLDFSDESFDRIFMVTVIGEVENKGAYIREFYRLLRADGILSISELAGDPDKMTPQELMALTAKAGFVLGEMFGNQRNYTINFIKTKLL
ncbi:MAG: methyltransferase domain-containing protein [Candidatus Marinimicrobia bacterium]|nr:methyltransferase domain-containing protein [Candidatus Neomarinimicrobiota bacterium]